MEIKQELMSHHDKEETLFNFDDIAEDILSLNQSDDSFKDSNKSIESIQEHSAEQQKNSNSCKQISGNLNKSVKNKQHILPPEENNRISPESIEVEIKDCNMNYNSNYIVKYNVDDHEIGVLVIHNKEKDFKRTVLELFAEQHDIVFENEHLVYFEAFHAQFRTNYTVTPSSMPDQGVIYLMQRPCKK